MDEGKWLDVRDTPDSGAPVIEGLLYAAPLSLLIWAGIGWALGWLS